MSNCLPVPAPRLALLATLLAILAGCGGSDAREWRLTNITGHLPDLAFTLTDDSGAPATAEALEGKVVMLYFGYTHCPDVCPLSMVHLHQVMQKLGDQADNVRIAFVSVDPARDTPGALHRYVQAFDPRAIGLTGSLDDIRAMTKAFRVAFSHGEADAQGNYDVNHSSAVFVFDAAGRARLISGSTDDIDAIAHDVGQLLDEPA